MFRKIMIIYVNINYMLRPVEFIAAKTLQSYYTRENVSIA